MSLLLVTTTAPLESRLTSRYLARSLAHLLLADLCPAAPARWLACLQYEFGVTPEFARGMSRTSPISPFTLYATDFTGVGHNNVGFQNGTCLLSLNHWSSYDAGGLTGCGWSAALDKS